jgi:hypothetical protein
MTTSKIALVALALVSTTACSRSASADETYTYMCKVPKEHKSYPVRINVDKAILLWRGQTFNGLHLIDGCRYNYQATRLLDTAELCTATQGYANLAIGDSSFECQMRK